MLRVIGLEDAKSFPSIVMTDDYIPLQYRTYEDLLGGARYIHLGNGRSRLLELIVSSHSMTVRGFIVLLVDKRAHRTLTGPERAFPGLPIVNLPEGAAFAGPLSSQCAKSNISFKVFADDGLIELQIGGATNFDQSARHGDVYFLTLEGDLVGIRVRGLSKSSIDHFSSFLR